MFVGAHHITNVRTWLFNCSPFSVVFYIYCIWINCQNTRSAACGQYPCLMLYFTLIARLKHLLCLQHSIFVPITNCAADFKFSSFKIWMWRFCASLKNSKFYFFYHLVSDPPQTIFSRFPLYYLFAIRAYWSHVCLAKIFFQFRYAFSILFRKNR